MYELYKNLSTDVATSNLSAAKEISDDVGEDQYRNLFGTLKNDKTLHQLHI